ncbi:hypothetical protein AVEN_131226-1 [Araneus ventricosus]|uniref:Uncharacterized protein n=1 Tax=Araneus ventricosus TaxID=182803 RepID=A0A4Y2IP87_ARAVE|nr:hypothetical protein AVEN_131226-1 [Araneus ventricosus]
MSIPFAAKFPNQSMAVTQELRFLRCSQDCRYKKEGRKEAEDNFSGRSLCLSAATCPENGWTFRRPSPLSLFGIKSLPDEFLGSGPASAQA